MPDEIIRLIEKEAKEYHRDMPPSHDWSHIERVLNLGLKIGEKEGANSYVIKLSSLLHDIGRKKEMELKGKIDHAELSSEIAREILLKYNVNKSIVEQVSHCISSHRFRNSHKPETIEAKVLFDADKLDSIGAIGVAREYVWIGEIGGKIYSDKNYLGTGYEKNHSGLTEYLFKLSKIKDKMQTKEGKRIAKIRNNIIVNYFENLKKEIQGEQ